MPGPDSARIFISHSCKDADASQPLAPHGDPERERQEILAFARDVRSRVYAGLAETFDVWLDQRALRPGADWSAKLHRQLGVCDGAVILLDRESIRSTWLQKEATVLAWRRDIGATITVVPAFLGDLRPEDLADTPLAPLSLTLSQAARAPSAALSDANAAALAEQVVAGLADVARQQAETDMERWIAKVRRLLRQVDPEFLGDAARELQIGREEWIDGDEEGDLSAVLAHQLLFSRLAPALTALERLQHGMRSPDTFGVLVDLVRPVWVDIHRAQSLNSVLSLTASRLAVLSARHPDTARDHVRRARFCEVRPERIIAAVPPTGASPAIESREAFLEVMCAHWNGIWPDDRAAVEKALHKERPERFILLGPHPVPDGVLRGLRRRYRRLRFIVLAKESAAPALAARLDAGLVRPNLTSDEEDDAWAELTAIQDISS